MDETVFKSKIHNTTRKIMEFSEVSSHYGSTRLTFLTPPKLFRSAIMLLPLAISTVGAQRAPRVGGEETGANCKVFEGKVGYRSLMHPKRTQMKQILR